MENNNIKVSVVMATYNGEQFLSEQLESIANQARRPDELIILDDCSTDRTYDLAKQFAQTRPWVKLLKNEENIGVNRSFFKVIKAASGDLIFCSDQDDVWCPDKIALFVESWSGEKLVFSDAKVVDAEGKTIHESELEFHGRGVVEESDPWFFLYNNCISGHNMMLSRSLADAMTYPPGTRFFDQWLGLLGSILGDIKYLNVASCMHRIHSSNVSNNPSVRKQNKRESVSLSKRVRFRQKRENSLEYFEAVTGFSDPSTEFGEMVCALVDSLKLNRPFFNARLCGLLFHHRKKLRLGSSRFQQIRIIKNQSMGEIFYWL